MKTFTGKETLLIVVLVVAFIGVTAWKANLQSPKVPIKQCSEIHLLQTWRGVGPDGTMVRHFHAFVHERYELVIDMRRAIPVWPDALMCFYPPADSA